MEILAGAHDPEGKLAQLSGRLEGRSSLVSQLTVAISPASSPDLRNKLDKLGIQTIKGSSQPEETKQALYEVSGGSVWYVDLDKILFMLRYHPQEVLDLSQANPAGLVILGRTRQAFQTCPDAWQATEAQINQAMEACFKIPGFDVCAGSFLAEHAVINLLKNKPPSNGWAHLVEYPFLVHLTGYPVFFKALEGLEWEDPDRYQDEIKPGELDQWKQEIYNTSLEWDKRIEAARQMTAALINYNGNLSLEDRKHTDQFQPPRPDLSYQRFFPGKF